jgi:hypothetical protein
MHGGVRDGRGGATRWSRGDDEILRVSLVFRPELVSVSKWAEMTNSPFPNADQLGHLHRIWIIMTKF